MTIWLIIAVSLVVVLGFTAFTGAPYVPSRRADVERAFDELYLLNPSDTLVDIGSGDGVVLRMASRRGARAVGLEIHPFLVLLARWLSRHDKQVSIRWSDYRRAELPVETTVVYVFGDDRDMSRMVRYVEQQATRLAKPLWLISYGFEVGGYRVTKTVGAHSLYKIHPLHK